MAGEKVIISVINDLATDQRVHRVALTLHNEGYDVLLVGRKLKNSPEVNRVYKIKRFKLLFNKGPLFYACYNLRLFIFLLFAKCDILISNDLDTLPANYCISKIRKKKLIYDSHEYFTEVPELINRPGTKKIWQKIERKILPKIKYSYTVCESLAEIYNEKYGINMKVIRNVPFYKEKIEKQDNPVKIIIYQGALNINRGLEEMISAMQFIDNAVFQIIGDGDIREKLIQLVKEKNLTDKVKFLGRKKLEELHKYTANADLGISLEQKAGLNYYYSLPNKIFDNIQARIPVLCSDFPEMNKIVSKYNIGKTISDYSPVAISKKVKEILNTKYDNELFEKAAKELCWENEKTVLLEILRT
ncbi:MAG: hypothetical protein Kow0068_12460 [Marinilabiliales bacterium]